MRDEVRRRLRLEFLEDRTLPAAPWPTADADPPASDDGAADGSDPDAAEYEHPEDAAAARSSGSDSHGTWYSDERTPATGYRTASEYADAAGDRTAARVDVAAFAPPPPAAVPPAAAATPVPVRSTPRPDGQPPQAPNPPPAAAPAPVAVAPPADEVVEVAGRPESDPAAGDKSVEAPAAVPVPVAAEPEGASSAASTVTRLVDELAVRADLPASWDEAADRLLDGLAAATGAVDPGPDWARVGYWAVSVAAVGVAVEFARHAARARRPDAEPGEPRPLAVKR